MKSLRILAAICIVSSATPVFAQFYNFENLPSQYWSDSYGVTTGGNTDIGSYYSGVTFGTGVQGIHTSSGYPAHSGVLEIDQSSISSPTLSFSVTLANIGEVSFWYSTLDGFTARAYDSNGNLLSSMVETPNVNTLGTSGISSLYLNSGSGYISTVTLTDSAGVGTFLTIDDLSLTAPDATSSFVLLGLAGVSLLAFRKQFVTQ